jgi:hypothetical protein
MNIINVLYIFYHLQLYGFVGLNWTIFQWAENVMHKDEPGVGFVSERLTHSGREDTTNAKSWKRSEKSHYSGVGWKRSEFSPVC